jgi:hypothetical protein
MPFSFPRIKHIDLKDDNLANSFYSLKKRRKELARKQKQEKKRQRRLEKAKIETEENPDPSKDEI